MPSGARDTGLLRAQEHEQELRNDPGEGELLRAVLLTEPRPAPEHRPGRLTPVDPWLGDYKGFSLSSNAGLSRIPGR